MKKMISVLLSILALASLLSACGGKHLSKHSISTLDVSDLEKYEWIGLDSYYDDTDPENACFYTGSESYYKYTFNKKSGYLTVTDVDLEDGTEEVEESVRYKIMDDNTIQVDYGEGLSWLATISQRTTDKNKKGVFLEFTEVLRFNGENILVPLQCVDLDSVYKDETSKYSKYVWSFRK